MKKLVVPFAAVAALGVGLIFWLSSSIDNIVKEQIEVVGSELMGVPVTVDFVDLDLSEGAGTISGLVVGNPAGYKSAHAMSLSALKLNIGLLSLAKQNPIVIESLVVDSLDTNLEFRETTSNLTEISEAIQKNSSNAEEKTQKSESGSSLMLAIKELHVTGTTVSIVGVENSETKSIPTISMQNVGGETGASPVIVSGAIISKLITEILKEAAAQRLKKTVTDTVDELTKGLLDSLNKAIE